MTQKTKKPRPDTLVPPWIVILDLVDGLERATHMQIEPASRMLMVVDSHELSGSPAQAGWALASPRALEVAERAGNLAAIDGNAMIALLAPLRTGPTLADIEACERGSRDNAFRDWISDLARACERFDSIEPQLKTRIADWARTAGHPASEILGSMAIPPTGSEEPWWVSWLRATNKPKTDSTVCEWSDLPATDTDFVDQIFADTGPLAAEVPEYETRWAQVSLAHAVAETLENQTTLLAEAGTGVGKSLGYLVPAILWAGENSRRVVVSTHTKSLQDQLYRKDLPVALEAVRHVRPDWSIRTAILRGRGNYLCRDRWLSLSSTISNDPEFSELMMRLAIWVSATETGDLSELSFTEAESMALRRFTAIEENCPFDRCRLQHGNRCFLTRARTNARAANLLLVNHALLLTEIETESYVLTDCTGLIIDEAHHLEGVATGQLSFRLAQAMLGSNLKDFVDLKGQAIEGLAAIAVRSIGSMAESEVSHEGLTRLRDAVLQAQTTEGRIAEFFSLVAAVLDETETQQTGSFRYRVQSSDRTSPAWANVEMAWESVSQSLQSLRNVASWIATTLRKLVRDLDTTENEEVVLASVDSWIEGLTGLLTGADEVVHQPSPNRVYWIETSGFSKSVSLNSAPIMIGEDLGTLFDNDKRAVVLTSATLATGGTFDFLKSQLLLEDSEELILPSPFDHTASTLVVLPSQSPEPSAPGFDEFVATAIRDVSMSIGGGTLALFTSLAALRRAADTVRPELAAIDVETLAQGVDGSAPALADRLRRGDRVVVLGAATFWEGVDIQGSGLSALIIARLPFDVPNDPIFQARSELFEDPFREYSVPRAVMRFRQGFGRLIRSQTDRGVVFVLDRRVVSKRYGREFMLGLPPTEVHYAEADAFGSIARSWLDR